MGEIFISNWSRKRNADLKYLYQCLDRCNSLDTVLDFFSFLKNSSYMTSKQQFFMFVNTVCSPIAC